MNRNYMIMKNLDERKDNSRQENSSKRTMYKKNKISIINIFKIVTSLTIRYGPQTWGLTTVLGFRKQLGFTQGPSNNIATVAMPSIATNAAMPIK